MTRGAAPVGGGCGLKGKVLTVLTVIIPQMNSNSYRSYLQGSHVAWIMLLRITTLTRDLRNVIKMWRIPVPDWTWSRQSVLSDVLLIRCAKCVPWLGHCVKCCQSRADLCGIFAQSLVGRVCRFCGGLFTSWRLSHTQSPRGQVACNPSCVSARQVADRKRGFSVHVHLWYMAVGGFWWCLLTTDWQWSTDLYSHRCNQ